MKELPKKLYVTVECPGTENEFLGAAEALEELDIKVGDKRKLVGEYELKRKVEVKAEVVIQTEVG